MRPFIQEKMQVTVTQTDESDGEHWVSFESARRSSGMEDRMPLSLAGETDASKDTNRSALADGYTRRKMSGIDDENVDLFYGRVVGEDGEGFLERGNYLDRL